ncbi:hypothetical protein ED28_16120 [[Pantoea] beijingensis]|uniref:Uncharacterized protein n=1 Tax=[Pantoea] beijingensis TaxID=1324864 RepID=A0A443IA62_9GAMM|nr:hypothetical protein ED28_16120 [[Pantoea] beijingensis]
MLTLCREKGAIWIVDIQKRGTEEYESAIRSDEKGFMQNMNPFLTLCKDREAGDSTAGIRISSRCFIKSYI